MTEHTDAPLWAQKLSLVISWAASKLPPEDLAARIESGHRPTIANLDSGDTVLVNWGLTESGVPIPLTRVPRAYLQDDVPLEALKPGEVEYLDLDVPQEVPDDL